MGRSWEAASTEAGCPEETGKTRLCDVWIYQQLEISRHKYSTRLAKVSTDFFSLDYTAVQIKLQPTNGTV